MKKTLIVACFVFLCVIVPVTAMSAVYTIDPSQSFVSYGGSYWYGPDGSDKFSLSGTFSYSRMDGYLGVPTWTQLHLTGINLQTSPLPQGPFAFPAEYHGIFTGSVFDGNDWGCSMVAASGYTVCLAPMNTSHLKGALTDEYMDIYGSVALDDYHSYFFTICATVGEVAAVPEPATMLLLGLGLAGVAVARKRFQK